MNDRSQMRFHDPNAPRFLLTDQKGKFALGIGGYVRATGEYDLMESLTMWISIRH